MRQRRIRILGGGESGIGAALLAKKLKYDVFLSDFGLIEENRKEELLKNKIPFEEEGHTFEILVQADLVVKSPGIRDDVKIIQSLKDEGIEIVSEIEFAYRFSAGKILAITGSNGKTTTTHLIYHLLKSAGKSVAEVGNVGKSFARQVFEEEKEHYVIEVSSFQLDGIATFRPDVAILLNITSDHLDRYDYDIDKYAAAKFRISENQTDEDVFIYLESDPGIERRLKRFDLQAKQIPITESMQLEKGAIHLAEDVTYNVQDANLIGKHNQVNLLAAILGARQLGISFEEIENALPGFENEAHRLEMIGQKDDVLFINDSKATNVDAVYYALEAMIRPVIWIAGGTDKGNNYDALQTLVKEKVKTLICLGIDNQKLKEAFGDKIKDLKETRNIEQAVEWASEESERGDVVLLSPACASFDLFSNYRERGDLFKESVKRIINQ